jgi:hypothetical protein
MKVMTPRDFNWKALAMVGLVAGLAQVATGVAMYLAGIYFVSWSIFVSLFLLLLCIVFGTRWYTVRHLKREITYGQALIVGMVISVSTGIVYAIYNIISISFFYPHFLDDFVRISVARASASRQTPEVIASTREMITANKIAVGNLTRLSVAGSFLSVFASLILRKKRKP